MLKLKIFKIFRLSVKWKNDEGQILVVLNKLILVLNEWSFRDVNECCKWLIKLLLGISSQKRYLYSKGWLITTLVFKESNNIVLIVDNWDKKLLEVWREDCFDNLSVSIGEGNGVKFAYVWLFCKILSNLLSSKLSRDKLRTNNEYTLGFAGFFHDVFNVFNV